MQRLNEPECEIIELIQKAQPRELSRGSVLANADRDNSLVGECIDKLVRRNYISEKRSNEFRFYFISESNKQVKPRNVKCPKCHNIRRVFSESQEVAICKNRECRTPAGKRTVFWVKKRSVKFVNGETEYLNQA